MEALNNPTTNESTLSIDEVITRLNLDDLHYLFFTMADIVKWLSDNEAMYHGDLEGQGALQGAIMVENLAKQELSERVEKVVHNQRMESYRDEGLVPNGNGQSNGQSNNGQSKVTREQLVNSIDTAISHLEDIEDSYPEVAFYQYKRLVNCLTEKL